jgi:NAD(P)-dependent dehydrogenase (short-subunit alcohol dehydrogenase family)
MHDLNGRTAFVTGGASGIGLALGRACAEAGMKVMLADVEAGALDEAVKNLRDVTSDVRGVACDVADAESVERAAQATFDAFGRVHVVCNNAGVAARGGIEDISLDNWRWVIDVNLMGVLHGIRSFLPHIRAHGEGGHIVNTASMAGLTAAGQITSYVMTKHAVVGLSLALRSEAVSRGVGVLAVCPGAVETPILDKGAIGGFVGRDYYLRGQGMKTGYDPDRLARDTLKAIKRNKALLVAPKQAYASWVFARLAPGLLQRFSIRFIADQRKRQHAKSGVPGR